ncbi:MAG: ABC transporter substrate-binding protein, partial [Pseudomonadota bacterium]
MSYLLQLREDIRFHNGQLLTPELVVWNFERYLNPETGWLCLRIFDGSRGLKIERVTQESDRVVRIELNQRDSAFMHKLANTQCNLGIVHPDSLDPGGNWRSPVGTGPYQLSRWKQGEFVELQRHASYRPLPDPRDGLG